METKGEQNRQYLREMDQWIRPRKSPPVLPETALLSTQAMIVLRNLHHRYGVIDSSWNFKSSGACSCYSGTRELSDDQLSLINRNTMMKQEQVTPPSSPGHLSEWNQVLLGWIGNTRPYSYLSSYGTHLDMQFDERMNDLGGELMLTSRTKPVAAEAEKLGRPVRLGGVLDTTQNQDGNKNTDFSPAAVPCVSVHYMATCSSQSNIPNVTYVTRHCNQPSVIQGQSSLSSLDSSTKAENIEKLMILHRNSSMKTEGFGDSVRCVTETTKCRRSLSCGYQPLETLVKKSCKCHKTDIQDCSSIAMSLTDKERHANHRQVTPQVHSSNAVIQQFLNQHAAQPEKGCEPGEGTTSCVKNLNENAVSRVEDLLAGIAPTSNHASVKNSEQNSELVIDVTSLKGHERDVLFSQLETSREICLMVVYQDNRTSATVPFSQLTEDSVHSAKGVLVYAGNQMMLFPVTSDPSLAQWCRSVLHDLLCKETIIKVSVNSKQLVKVLLRELGAKQSEASLWQLEDPSVAGWLLKPDNPPSTLQQLCQLAEQSSKSKSEKRTFWPDCHDDDMPNPDSRFYFLAKVSLAVMEHQCIVLKSLGLWRLFLHVEMPLVLLLAVMELQPIVVDMAVFLHYSDVLKKKLQKLESRVYKLATHPFSINSTSQLRQVLYEELGLDKQMPSGHRVTLTTSSHHKSTSEAMLIQLSPHHPLPSVILQYRQLTKLKSTYIDGIMGLVQHGVLYTHWDQTAAATGRLTSFNPNLQAVPKTSTIIDDFDSNIIVGSEPTTVNICAREPYVCGENNLFLSADFQQIELRLLAHLTDDITLKTIFSNVSPLDVFVQLTAKWMCKPESKVTNVEREQTKRLVYSIVYGVGRERLAQYLKVTASMAKEIISKFLVAFPAIQHFTQHCTNFARQHGYTETLMGRKRWLPNITHRTALLRAQAERQAVNFCVQGSAADICKCAMLRVEEALRSKRHLKARLLLQIHDELVWELPKDQLQETCEMIRKVMEDDRRLCHPFLPGLKVPLLVCLTHGFSWAHLSPHTTRPLDTATCNTSAI